MNFEHQEIELEKVQGERDNSPEKVLEIRDRGSGIFLDERSKVLDGL